MILKMKLHILLAERRMSQKELSKLTGIRPNSISAYYNDNYKQISKEHVEKICTVLDCNLTDLFELKKD